MQRYPNKRQIAQVMDSPEGFLTDALDHIEGDTGQHHQVQSDDTQSYPEGHEGAGKGNEKIHQTVSKEVGEQEQNGV